MVVAFLVWTTVARTVVSMLPIGLFFAAASRPDGGAELTLLGAALTFGTGLGLWPSGWVLDRVGRWRGLRASLVVGAVTVALAAVAAGLRWPPLVLVGLMAAAGVALAPVIATPRAVLPELVHPDRMVRASGIEASSFEVALILAPIAAAVVGPFGAVPVLVAAAGALAVTWTLFPRPSRPAGPASPAVAAPLLSRPVLRLAGLGGLLGVSGGLLEPALARLPSPEVVGAGSLPFVALGVGSAIGGLVAARAGRPRAPRAARWLFAVHAVALVAAWAAPGAWRLVALVAAGAPIAPLVSLAGLHVDRWSDHRRTGETLGLIASVLLLATGMGQAAAGRLLARVAPPTLLVVAAGLAMLAALAVATTAVRRSDS